MEVHFSLASASRFSLLVLYPLLPFFMAYDAFRLGRERTLLLPVLQLPDMSWP